jgi:hypothetical protein
MASSARVGFLTRGLSPWLGELPIRGTNVQWFEQGFDRFGPVSFLDHFWFSSPVVGTVSPVVHRA